MKYSAEEIIFISNKINESYIFLWLRGFFWIFINIKLFTLQFVTYNKLILDSLLSLSTIYHYPPKYFELTFKIHEAESEDSNYFCAMIYFSKMKHNHEINYV